MLRIEEHPILGSLKDARRVKLDYDGREIEGREGEPIAAALMAAGVRTFRYTKRFHQPRGIYCAIGRCTDCMMIVDGTPNVRTCVTPVKEGMKVETQLGYGK
jgi:predicted molibdopterin-dependent oxidoreductase YjgC